MTIGLKWLLSINYSFRLFNYDQLAIIQGPWVGLAIYEFVSLLKIFTLPTRRERYSQVLFRDDGLMAPIMAIKSDMCILSFQAAALSWTKCFSSFLMHFLTGVWIDLRSDSLSFYFSSLDHVLPSLSLVPCCCLEACLPWHLRQTFSWLLKGAIIEPLNT